MLFSGPGIDHGSLQSGAYSLDLLQEKQVLNERVAGQPIVLFWKPGTASALDSSAIASGRDVGSTSEYIPAVDNQILTFSSLEGGLFLDQETGSIWDILGKALEGSLAGRSLVRLPHHDTFWFAWAAFFPDVALRQ